MQELAYAVGIGLFTVTALILGALLASSLYFTFVSRLPIAWQRPYYNFWKERIVIALREGHNIYAYPMLVFIDLKADQHFEEGGMDAVETAFKAHLDRMCERMQSCLTSPNHTDKSDMTQLNTLLRRIQNSPKDSEGTSP